MSIINAIILGIVQGLTEFIPVSSSGHLVIASHFLNLGNAFTMDVLLNIGTLLALVIYYRVKILSIIQRLFTGGEWPFVLKVVVATLPAVLFGILFEAEIAKWNGMIWVVIIALIAVGIPMILFGDPNKNADDRPVEKSVGWRTTAKVGVAQVLSLVPGVSRSGITILTGLRSNLSAARAAEFSFLMAIPILAGASLKVLLSSVGIAFVRANLGAVIIGNLASFVAGLLAINFLITLLSKSGLKYFGWYRVALALILIAIV